MIINLNLDGRNYITHNEIITVPEEEVKLSFASSVYVLGTLVATVSNGEERLQFKLTKQDKEIDITDFCKKAGQVEITVCLTVRGKVARRWQIEPLCVREIDGSFEVIPEIEELKERLERAEKAIAEMSKLII